MTKLNAEVVKALEVPATGAKTYYFPEAIVQKQPVPGGFGIRVTSNGVRTFILRYRNRDRVERFHKIGRYPDLPVVTALAEARSVLQSVAKGEDPHQSRDDRKEKVEAAARDANTFKAVTELYFSMGGEKRKGGGRDLRSREWREAVLERLVYPEIGDHNIAGIKRKAIIALLDKIEAENGVVMADRTLAIVRRVMTWHETRDDEFESPIRRGMSRSGNTPRQRILKDDEIRAVWKAAEPSNGPFEAMIRFTLLTACRRDEAREMEWTELDGANWTLPGARNKTGLDLLRPLPAQALAALPAKSAGKYVFSRDGGHTPMGNLADRKTRLDKLSGVTGWTIHDLRRTARSLMSRLSSVGLLPDHAERCLGHALPGIRGVYDVYEYAPEKQKAYELLAARIETIIDPPTDNVVTFERRA